MTTKHNELAALITTQPTMTTWRAIQDAYCLSEISTAEFEKLNISISSTGLFNVSK